MKTQLKVAVTVALTTLGFAAATPVLAFPSSALEFSQQTYTPPAYRTTAEQRVVLAAAPTSTVFPSGAVEP